MDELKSLTQTGFVRDYNDAFDAIMRKFSLPPEHALSCFIEGMKKPLRFTVRLFKPQTIQDAYALSKLKEE